MDTHALLLGAAQLEPARLPLPLSGIGAQAGFPSPAEDFQEDTIDLNEHLIRNPPATFLYRASGHSMVLEGIVDGDTLIVDRSVEPKDGDLVIATWDGQVPVCKRLKVCKDHIELHSRNPHYSSIVLEPEAEVEAFVVVGIVRKITRETARVRFA